MQSLICFHIHIGWLKLTYMHLRYQKFFRGLCPGPQKRGDRGEESCILDQIFQLPGMKPGVTEFWSLRLKFTKTRLRASVVAKKF